MHSLLFFHRQENDRLHMELDRCQNMPPPPSYGLRSDGLRGDGLRDRSRSPEPFSGRQSVDARIHVEVAELKDKLEQTQNELRRTQAELRLNTGDYERSHVELEQMQEKVSKFVRIFLGVNFCRKLTCIFNFSHMSYSSTSETPDSTLSSLTSSFRFLIS